MPNVKCIGNEFYSSSSGSAAVLFPALRELTVSRLDGLEEWMVPGGEGDQLFPCLEELCIEECRKLRQLPTLGCLPRLKILRITRMHSVKCIGNELYSSSSGSAAVLFPALEELVLYQMDGLEEWMVPGGEGDQVFPCLGKLSLWCCVKLISIDWHGLRQLPSLVNLAITACHSLSDFPEDDWLGGLAQLEYLSIGGFLKEEAFPKGFLNSIQHLNLSGSLKRLEICGWDKLKSIPHQLQHLTALEELWIIYFDGEEFEEALPDWFANLSSLQFLSIHNCNNLKYMPSSTALQRLFKLKTLNIWECPYLSENCRKENGSEWPKISHIPSICLQGTWVQARWV